MKPVDVLIVGGGPAGLATSIAVRRKGLRVAVIDWRRPPINKTCGEGLLPSAIGSLGKLGIQIHPRLGFAFSTIRFADKKSSVAAPILGGGIGLRRRDLHRLLTDRAEEEGVRLVWGAHISAIESTGIWANGEFYGCRWLIGADGQHSTVRKFAGLDPGKRARSRLGFRQHFAIAPWSNAVEVHWSAGLQLIVTPTGPEETCIVVLTRDPGIRVEEALDRFPEIAKRLRSAKIVGRETGATTCLSRARAAVRANVALVGDASCTMDGISGTGLSLAFQEALALAEALEREDLAGYRKAHAQITKAPVRMTQLLLIMDASNVLRRMVLSVLARHPSLFSRLIALHAGVTEAPSCDSRCARNGRLARLGCRLCEPS